jgi:hypothetical protein
MSRAYTKDKRVLAIDPSTRGFGFAVLEGPNRLIDWGVKETRSNKNTKSLKLIAELIERYQLTAIIVEDYAGRGSRRLPADSRANQRHLKAPLEKEN